MDSNDTMYDSSRNLMHQTDDEIHIGENAKITQHYLDIENADVGDDEEHLEATHLPIIYVNGANKNSSTRQRKNVLKVHTRSRPCSSCSPFDRNCPKQLRIFNSCDKVDLKSLKHSKELYTDPRGININRMMLIGQLMWIVTSGK